MISFPLIKPFSLLAWKQNGVDKSESDTFSLLKDVALALFASSTFNICIDIFGHDMQCDHD